MRSPTSPLPSSYFSVARDVQWIEPLPGERVGLRVRCGQTRAAYSFFEIVVAPLVGPPMHIHRDADEVLYVLQGSLDIVCEDRLLHAVAGDMAVIPRGSRHAFRNFSSVPARALAMFSPGGFEEFMVAMAMRPLSELLATARMFHADIVGPQIERKQALEV